MLNELQAELMLQQVLDELKFHGVEVVECKWNSIGFYDVAVSKIPPGFMPYQKLHTWRDLPTEAPLVRHTSGGPSHCLSSQVASQELESDAPTATSRTDAARGVG